MKKRFELRESGFGNETNQNSQNSQNRNGLTLTELGSVLYQKKLLITIVTISVMLIATAVMISMPNLYKSEASLLPSGQQDQMADLKRLAGLSTGQTEENSSELFPTILSSRTVGEAVLSKRYNIENNDATRSTTLMEYFGTEQPDKLLSSLRSITTIDLNSTTGLLEIGVETTSPILSQGIAYEYLTQLNSYNIDLRQSEATRRVEYLDRELDSQRRELTIAENKLSDFLMLNRNYATTTEPELLKELSQMRREVELKSQVYGFLSQEYQSARLDVQKDLPVIRILDRPNKPTTKSGPRRVLTILFSGMAGFMMTTLLLLLNLVIRPHLRFDKNVTVKTSSRLKKEITELDISN